MNGKNRLGFVLTLSLLFTNQALHAERTGEEVFKTACFACHTAGMSNAPTAHVFDNWKPFIEKVMSINHQPSAPIDVKNIENYATQLLPFAKEGKALFPEKGVMPPKGTCQSCSDSELKSAIIFMLTPNQQ